ncbi:hypothetical protein GINT2_000228 [Glugoides intestinalis]
MTLKIVMELADTKDESKRTAKSKKIIKSESLNWKMLLSGSFVSEFTTLNGYRSAILFKTAFKIQKYFEATIVSEIGHARIGIATCDAEINGPIGIDAHGYSFASRNGYAFSSGKRIRYGERFGKNDIISCFIDDSGDVFNLFFFINGDEVKNYPITIKHAEYFPAISVCKGCILNVNLGPYFVFREKVAKSHETPKTTE